MEWEEGQVGGAGKTSHIGPPGCAPFSRLLGPRIPGQRGQPSHPCLRLRASSEAGPPQSSGAENLGFLRAGCRGQRKSEGSRSVQDARRQGWDPAPDLGAQSGDQRGCSLPGCSGLPPRDPATARCWPHASSLQLRPPSPLLLPRGPQCRVSSCCSPSPGQTDRRNDVRVHSHPSTAIAFS